MEEILASIRRIISEEGGGDRDSKTATPAPEPAAESDDDILDLTEVIAGGGGAEAAPAAEDELDLEAVAAAVAEADARLQGAAEPAAPSGRTPFVVEPDTGPELEAEEELEAEAEAEAEAEGDLVAEATEEEEEEEYVEEEPEDRAEPEAAPAPLAEPATAPKSEPEPIGLHSVLNPVAEATAIPEPMPDDGAPTLEESIDLPPEPEPAPAPAPVVAAPVPTPTPAPTMSMDQVIQRAAESAVAASGALATVAPPASSGSAPAGDHSLGFGVTEQHIETAVREVLKPRLRDWLDKNLAHLVERLVREEIQRLVEQSERPK